MHAEAFGPSCLYRAAPWRSRSRSPLSNVPNRGSADADAAPDTTDAGLLGRLLVNLARHLRHVGDPGLRERAEALLREGAGFASLSAVEIHALLMKVRRFCHIEDLPEVLSMSGLPVVYNFQAAFEDNVAGPWDRFPDGDGVTPGRRWTLLGADIGYPIGIPASSLTVNARYIEYFARQGFNVLTYKTVRSRKKSAYQFPNWVYLESASAPLDVIERGDTWCFVGTAQSFPGDPTSFSTANSFGVPSKHPDDWSRDVREAVERLGAGKLLIVSVMGSSEVDELKDPERLADDFAALAVRAEAAKAHAVELNLSCPNTLDPEAGRIQDPVCYDAELTALIVRRVREALRPQTPLVAKLSWMTHARLERVMEGIAERIDAVSGINTLQAKVVDQDGRPTFGERELAGISGVAIRDYGLDFVRFLTRLRDKRSWSFEILAMGGVMNAADVRAYFRAGANAVQTATAAEENPTLPAELLQANEPIISLAARTLLAVLAERPRTDLPRLASTARLEPSKTRAALNELAEMGMIRVIQRESDRPVYEVDDEALESQLA